MINQGQRHRAVDRKLGRDSACDANGLFRTPVSSDVAGYTLIELVIVIAVTLVLLGTMGTALMTGQRVFTEISLAATANETTRRLLDRMVYELRFADLASLTLDEPTDARAVTFRPVLGFDGVATILGAPRTLSFDDGKVVLEGVTLAEDIGDVLFNLVGSELVMFVEIEKTYIVGGTSQTLVRKLETRIRL